MVTIYEIRIQGYLDPSWSDWLEEMTITPEDNYETLICGPVPDQAALHGILNRIRDMNLKLLSVTIKKERSLPE